MCTLHTEKWLNAIKRAGGAMPAGVNARVAVSARLNGWDKLHEQFRVAFVFLSNQIEFLLPKTMDKTAHIAFSPISWTVQNRSLHTEDVFSPWCIWTGTLDEKWLAQHLQASRRLTSSSREHRLRDAKISNWKKPKHEGFHCNMNVLISFRFKFTWQDWISWRRVFRFELPVDDMTSDTWVSASKVRWSSKH